MSNAAAHGIPDLDALDTEQKLDYLLLLLQNLPRTPLGPKKYNFHKYTVTASAVEAAGSHQAAVIDAIEDVFGPVDGGMFVTFEERGEGLEAIVPLLHSSINDATRWPNTELKQWLDLFLRSACITFLGADMDVSTFGRAFGQADTDTLQVPPLKRVPKPKAVFGAHLAPARQRSATPATRANSAAPSRGSTPIAAAAPSAAQSGAQDLPHSRKRPSHDALATGDAKKQRATVETSAGVPEHHQQDVPIIIDSGDESEPVRASGARRGQGRVLVDSDVEMLDGPGGDEAEDVDNGAAAAPRKKRLIALKTHDDTAAAPKKPGKKAAVDAQGTKKKGKGNGKEKEKEKRALSTPVTTSATHGKAKAKATMPPSPSKVCISQLQVLQSLTHDYQRKNVADLADSDTEQYSSEDETEDEPDDVPLVPSGKEMKAAKADVMQRRKVSQRLWLEYS